MKVIQTNIPDVAIIEPKVFGDSRGFFYESYNERAFSEAFGFAPNFVQDNHSLSAKHVLRGLHYQIHQPQAKLVRVIHGAALDVAVDLRKSSPTYGKWVAELLTEENKRMLWIPEGFAHGFLTLTDGVEFLYKTTDFYAPEHERCIQWNDPTLGIDWQLNNISPSLSAKDQQGTLFIDAEVFT